MSRLRALFLILTAILVWASPTRSAAVGDEENASKVAPLSNAFLNACTEGRLDEIEAALKEHPNWVHGRSESGETCLHVAGIKGQVQVSRLILKMGGDVNVRSTFAQGLRMHPLAWNVYGGHVENVRVLLEEGRAEVNLDYDDAKGSPITVLDTVLDIATDDMRDKPGLERFYELKELLLKHGAKQYKDLQNESKDL